MTTAELAGDLRRDVEHFRGLWRTARSADEKVTLRYDTLLYFRRGRVIVPSPALLSVGAD